MLKQITIASYMLTKELKERAKKDALLLKIYIAENKLLSLRLEFLKKVEETGQRMPKIIKKIKPDWPSVIDTIDTLPEEQQTTLFNSLSVHLQQLQNTPSKMVLRPLIPVLEILKQTYKPFPLDIKLTVKNIRKHLEEELGDYLKIFDADEDYFYLDQLRKIEPRTSEMYDKLKYEHKKDESVPRLTDIVPKKSERITKEVEEFITHPDITLNEYHRIASAKHSRKIQATPS